MKTPDKIKKGLECCSTKKPCPSCPMWDECKEAASLKPLWDNALAYIQQLEAANAELLTRCERLERERDAAVADMTTVIYNGAEIVCQFCKHRSDHKCAQICGFAFKGFEWRGVKEE